MPLPRKTLRPAVKTVVPSGPPVDYGWYGPRRGLPGAASYDATRDAGDYRTNSIVDIALRWLRRNAMQGELVVGVKDGKEYVPDDPAHPVIALMARPNPWQSPKVFLGGTFDALHVCGESYWFKVRDGAGRVAEIYWVPNYHVEPIPGRKRPIDGYRYAPDRKTWKPSEVVHICYEPDPDRSGRGTSPLKNQVRNLASLNVGERWSYAVLRRGHKGTVLVPRTPIYGAGNPDEAEMLAAKRYMEDDLSGENAGGIHPIKLPMDAMTIGLSPEEMMVNEILDRPESTITAAVGLTTHVLGISSSADTQTYENTRTYNRMAWENAVIPLQDLISEDGIQQQLLYATEDDGEQVAEFDDEPGKLCWWDRSEIAALKEDAESKVTRGVAIWTNDLATHDEARQLCDLEPLGEEAGGDLFFSEWQQEITAKAEPEPEPEDKGEDETDDPFELDEIGEDSEDDDDSPVPAALAARNGAAKTHDDPLGLAEAVKGFGRHRMGRRGGKRGQAGGARKPHDESLHPKDAHGRFTAKPDAGGTAKKPSAPLRVDPRLTTEELTNFRAEHPGAKLSRIKIEGALAEKLDGHWAHWKASGSTTDIAKVEAIKKSGVIPPVIVARYGERVGIPDGFHRLIAARQLGMDSLPGYVIRGGKVVVEGRRPRAAKSLDDPTGLEAVLAPEADTSEIDPVLKSGLGARRAKRKAGARSGGRRAGHERPPVDRDKDNLIYEGTAREQRVTPSAEPSKPSGARVAKAEHELAAKAEAEIVKAIGGKNTALKDGKYSPADVTVRRRDGGTDYVEVKSRVNGTKTSITVHDDALLRKARLQAETPGSSFHTVVMDLRGETGSGAYSGHDLYYKRGVGRFALSKMHKVGSKAELDRLMKMKDDDLPVVARAPEGWPPTGEALTKLESAAEKAHASRLAKDRKLKARKRAERQAEAQPQA